LKTIEKSEIGGTFSTCGRDEWCIQVLVGKPEGKISLGIPRHKWEDNINKDLREVGCGDMDWIDLAEERDRWLALVYAVMNLRVL
jgi:hypothetical protein